MTSFLLTPDEAQEVALAVIADMRRQNYTVGVEEAIADDAPYRPTMKCTRSGLELMVEAQGNPQYTRSLRELMTWAAGQRRHCEVYVATSIDADIPASMLSALNKDGVGLLLVEADSSISTSLRARNPALIVNPDPTLRFGARKQAVEEAVRRFNEVDRKAGLQEMCELVESETERLLEKAVRKGVIDKSLDAASKMDWATRINVLAAKDQYVAGHDPIIEGTLKDDLHSFRGARNRFDHQVRTAAAKRARERQYAERMMMGPRLVAELIPLARKL